MSQVFGNIFTFFCIAFSLNKFTLGKVDFRPPFLSFAETSTFGDCFWVIFSLKALLCKNTNWELAKIDFLSTEVAVSIGCFWFKLTKLFIVRDPLFCWDDGLIDCWENGLPTYLRTKYEVYPLFNWIAIYFRIPSKFWYKVLGILDAGFIPKRSRIDTAIFLPKDSYAWIVKFTHFLPPA